MSIPPTQGKSANGSSAEWRLDAELLRSTLARLRERPVSGAIWPPTLLAFETGLPITEVELALDPGRQRDRAAKPELAAWSVYEQLLYLLQPGDHDREVCQAAHERLAQHLWQRVSPPRDIAAIVSEADFMAAMAALTAKADMSLRAIAAAMWDLDRKHTWSKSGLEPYVAGKKLPPLDKKEHLRTLLLVLCDRAGRPVEDVEHYLWAWDSFRPRPRFGRPQLVTLPAASRDQEQNPLRISARRVPRTIQLTMSAATIGVIALIVLVVIVGVALLI
ncbi:hypothetical protein SAMN05216266_11444 [Amycolatopsis marina]|uniref:Uncharacterized protein n=2 Tax=Pseudonocardiaceae TaxID=2070 RepID=A0A1I1BGK2_9PSEU|nr:hypothetical protein [Amycolatopsis marina]SFB49489.1 hypothetical protein SAMN05216266_11444 [Amycolatopsis marina]